ncbi:MAG: hypothetical protein U0177_10890 [Kouleothrix sp.]
MICSATPPGLFGARARVDIGRIDKIAAGVGKRVEHRKRRALVGRQAELHGAEARRRYAQAGAP